MEIFYPIVVMFFIPFGVMGVHVVLRVSTGVHPYGDFVFASKSQGVWQCQYYLLSFHLRRDGTRKNLKSFEPHTKRIDHSIF